MGLGEILDTAFRLLRDHAALLLSIGLTMTIPTELLSRMFADPTAHDASALIATGIGFGLFIMVVSPIVTAAITHAVSESYLGRTATYGESLRLGFRLLMPLVGTAFLMILIMIPALLLLVIPAIYLMLSYMLVNQVIVLEGLTGWKALERSRALTKGNLLRVLAVYLVSMILMSVVSVALGLVTSRIPYAGIAINAVVQGVMTAYMSAAFVVLYFEIRCRKEAFDLQHLSEQVGQAIPQTATAS
jgi:MFS family permease